VLHATTPVDNNVQATVSRGKEWLRDMKPPQESLIAFHQPSGFLNKIQATLFFWPEQYRRTWKLVNRLSVC
jgi:hypothetical protein